MILISGVVLLTSKKPERSSQASGNAPSFTTISRDGTRSLSTANHRTTDEREDEDERQALQGQGTQAEGQVLWQLGDASDDEGDPVSGSVKRRNGSSINAFTVDSPRTAHEESALLIQDEETPRR